MPGIKVEAEGSKKVITMSQSWLRTYLECGESARRDMYEKVDGTNEQHLIGTAFHSYAETRENGADAETALDVARQVFDEAWPDVRHVVAKKPETAWQHSYRAIEAWEHEVWPSLDPMLVEYEMNGLAYHDDECEVWISGTPDLVDTDVDCWDWKTANDEYEAREYQRWAIQPTVYTWLLHVMGYEPSGWFRYWIWLKKSKCSQRVNVYRNEVHWSWMKDQVAQAADQILHSKAKKWHLNDQSWLCSEKWCPYYADCKGKHGDFLTKP